MYNQENANAGKVHMTEYTVFKKIQIMLSLQKLEEFPFISNTKVGKTHLYYKR